MKLLADSIQQVFGQVTPPPELGNLNNSPTGAAAISTVISNIINLIYGVSAIVCVFMIIFAGFQWLTSGGDKEAVAKARGRITWAIIGIVVLALMALFLEILSQIIHVEFFSGVIPFIGDTCAGRPNCH